MKIVKFNIWNVIAFFITLVIAFFYWLITILIGSVGGLIHILNMDICIVTKHVAHCFFSIYCYFCLFIWAVVSGCMAVGSPFEYGEGLFDNHLRCTKFRAR